MHSVRHAAAALAALAAITVAGCGTAASPTSAPAATASTTTSKASSDTNATATATPATPDVAATTADHKPGTTSPKVYSAKPKVKTAPSSQVMLSAAEQRSAAQWLDGLMHRSHLDFSKLPTKHQANMWTNDMTPKLHAAFAKDVKNGVDTFGLRWSAEDRSHMRATAVPEYTITAKRDYMERDYAEGVAFLVRTVEDFDMYGYGEDGQDVKGRLVTNLTVGVVPGYNGHRWQIATWFYEGGGSSWMRQDDKGDWVQWLE